LPSSRAATRSSFILLVILEDGRGERWTAVGGGETLDDALAFAVGSTPAGTRWRVARWSHLYGD
jgi:hypothetical protein